MFNIICKGSNIIKYRTFLHPYVQFMCISLWPKYVKSREVIKMQCGTSYFICITHKSFSFWTESQQNYNLYSCIYYVKVSSMQALDKKKTLLYLFHIKYIQIFLIYKQERKETIFVQSDFILILSLIIDHNSFGIEKK